MTSARWKAITEIFAAALELPQGARSKFIQEACAGDPDLEIKIANLLSADAAAGSFLEGPALSGFSSGFETDVKSPQLAAGTLISGRFKVLQFIGQGGMGQVYKVLDLELREPIALKTIRPEISANPNALSRFRREVQLTRRITHPNVCRTFDIERYLPEVGKEVQSEFIFLTMELLEGETLAEMLRRSGRLTTTDALPLVQQMIVALSAAHSVGVVHRDLKPSNMVLVPSGSGLRLVVTDFGLAHAVVATEQMSLGYVTDTVSRGNGIMGTLAYMAPEQLERGETTIASDIYSLGLVIYEMVTGERPFTDPIPFAEALKRIKQVAPSPKLLSPELDGSWEAAICRCLRMDPRDRFQNVLEVAETITSTRQRPWLPSGAQSSQVDSDEAAKSSLRRQLSSKRVLGIVGFLMAVALSALLLRYYQVRRDLKLTMGSTMLLTEIRNNTRDERFEGTTELLRHQLLQSPYFNLLDTGRIRNVLEQMNKPPALPPEPSVAREVALRTGAARVIFGAVSRIGGNYVLDVAIEEPDNNPNRARAEWENHWTWSARTANSDKEIPASFLSAIRDAGDWIRREVGESAGDIASVDVPPEDVTTSNWSALSEFTQAEKFKAAGQPDNAIIALQNAVAQDPRFALGYMRLGDLLISLNRYDEGYRAYRLALAQEQQQRLTRREKDRLTGIWAQDAGDFKAADTSFREYTVYYPNDYLGWFYRGYPLMMLGRPEEAIGSLKKAADIDPGKMFAPAHIARFDLIVSNFDDAAKWIEHLRDTSHSDDADLVEGEAKFLQNRYSDAEADFEKLKESKDSVYRSYGYSLLARVFAELGLYNKALEALDQGIAVDLESGDSVHRADKFLDRSYLHLKRRDYAACLIDIQEALSLDRSFQRSMVVASILGRALPESIGPLHAALSSALRKVQENIPREDFKPLSDIAKARVAGELLLANGNVESALLDFRRAALLESPIVEHEYLARGLTEAVRHEISKDSRDKDLDQALSEYRKTTVRPGQVWQWCLDYPPGYLSDEEFLEIKTAFEFGMINSEGEGSLNVYLQRRTGSDSGLPDVMEAQELLVSLTKKKFNSRSQNEKSR